jgi:hypothetical protein
MTSVPRVENQPSKNPVRSRPRGSKFSTLQMEVIRSSETSAHIRTTRHCIPEDGSIQNTVRCVVVDLRVQPSGCSSARNARGRERDVVR